MSGQFPDLDATAPTIPASELKGRIDAGEAVTVLDTRRPGDYDAWHVDAPGVRSVNVPFTEFLDDRGRPVEEVPPEVPDGALVVNCAIGVSSQYVGDLLVQSGRDVEVLEDGMGGWARLYEATTLEADAATILQYHRPSSGCLAYMILDGGEAAVVDPLRAFADRYVEDARERGAEIRYAIDTHVHADHVSGARELAARSGATLAVPEGAEARGLAYDADYRTVRGGDELPLGSTALSALELPGHTSEMTGYRVGDVLLCGDTIFPEGIARPDLEKGDEGAPDAARQLYDTLQSIAELPDETVIAPGHTSSLEPTRADGTHTVVLGAVRESLAAFGADREEFVEGLLANRPPRPSNYQRIIAINLGREAADTEEAFELELGPNNCAAN